jgi:sulfate-transporting ATPase
MHELLRFALLGLGIGAIYGLVAQGLVLIFLGNKVINFAQGSIAMVAAYAYYELTSAGLPLWAAAVLALGLSGALGAAIDGLIMRRLQQASSVTRLVATIGILTIIQSIAALRYGDATQFAVSILPQSTWHFGGNLAISADRALLFVIGLVTTGALILLHTKTRFGLATAAVADNARAAEVLGWSAQWISRANWILGALLAGMAGILIAPINGLNVPAMGTIIYGALAAALVGGFRSFALAMAGGVLLGVAQSETVRIGGEVGWSTAIPFVVIVIAVLMRSNGMTARGGSLPKLPKVGDGQVSAKTIGCCALALGCALLLMSGNMIDALVTTLIASILGLSIVTATGYTGQLSLASCTLAGLGALVAARCSHDLGLPFVPSLVAAAMAGAIAGVIVALVSLRVRGDILAIVTLAMALACEALILSNPFLTGGISGLDVPSPSLAGISLDGIAHPARFAIMCALVLLMCSLTLARLRRGTTGRRMLAVRSSERAALTLGISVSEVKICAHGVAGVLAGLAGGLEAFSRPQLVFSAFTVDATMALLAGTVLAGAGFIAAAPTAGFAVTGGVVYYLLSLTGWQQYLPLGLGIMLLINLVFVPDGLVPQNMRGLAWLMKRVTRNTPQGPVGTTGQDAPLDIPVHRSTRAGTLGVRDVRVSFGGVVALNDVTASLVPGQVEGLIGPNGAGKTSFIDAITGLTRHQQGWVELNGTSLNGLSVARRARAGLGRTLQGLELFDDLSVLENLVIGSEAQNRWTLLRDLTRPRAVSLSPGAIMAVKRFGLTSILKRRPGELPYGQRRLVAIARAVAAEPTVLLLDEPAAGLSAAERDELARMIRELAEDWGMAVLLVEHDVDLVMCVCDHVTVLEFGTIIAEGTPQEVRGHAEVRRAFLGVGEAA